MNPKVDEFLNREKKWQEEFEKLRMIILDCQLTEEMKWGVPCYTFQKGNVVLIHNAAKRSMLRWIQLIFGHSVQSVNPAITPV